MLNLAHHIGPLGATISGVGRHGSPKPNIYATAHPVAFALVAFYVVAWLCFEHQSFDWVSGATVATLFMTLLIQRAEHRDTPAFHAKVDELLRVEVRGRNELMKLDQEEPETIEAHQDKEFTRK